MLYLSSPAVIASFGHSSAQEPQEMCIRDSVAVHSNYRGQRIGDRLVEEMVKLCKSEGLVSMTLEVRSSNTVAQNLYRKYGFKMAGVRKEYYSDREDAIIMWNQLSEL